MTRRRWTRPSVGFFVLVASYGALVAFLAWGYCQPVLDRSWYILQRMQRDDFSGLTPSEVTTLARTLEKYPQFSKALIGRRTVGFVEPTDEGWLTLSDTPGSAGLTQAHAIIQAAPRVPLRVSIACRAPEQAYPVEVVFRSAQGQDVVPFKSDGETIVDWSARALPTARWIDVSVKPSAARASVGARPEIRIQAAETDARGVAP